MNPHSLRLNFAGAKAPAIFYSITAVPVSKK